MVRHQIERLVRILKCAARANACQHLQHGCSHHVGIRPTLNKPPNHYLPYGGKLSREKTFTNIADFRLSASFLREIWGVAYLKGCGIHHVSYISRWLRSRGGWILSCAHKWACCPIYNTLQNVSHDLKP